MEDRPGRRREGGISRTGRAGVAGTPLSLVFCVVPLGFISLENKCSVPRSREKGGEEAVLAKTAKAWAAKDFGFCTLGSWSLAVGLCLGTRVVLEE